MFIPGETVTQTITIPFLSSEISKVKVSYEQFGRLILTKEITSGFIPDTSTSSKCRFDVNLSQTDTLLFFDDAMYAIQLNVILKPDDNSNISDSARCASTEIKDYTGKQHIRDIYT